MIALARPSSDAFGLAAATLERHDGRAAGLRAIFARHKPATVFHLAAAGAKGSEDLDEIVDANVRLGAQLADAACLSGVECFIAAGSYFTRRGGTDAYQPVSLYAAAKKAFEALLTYYVQAHGLKAAVLCLYDIYGPDDPRPKLLNLLAESARTGRELKLSPGDQELDLLHVDDAAAAFLAAEAALGRETGPGLKEWCASSGQRLSVRALVELFCARTGLAPRVKFGGKPYRAREVMRPWSGPPVPAWAPRVPLPEGLGRVYGLAPDPRTGT